MANTTCAQPRLLTAAILIYGILALAVVMGIGRFSYTLVLPLMQQETFLTTTAAGYLATANYIGYFIGSLAAMLNSLAEIKKQLILWNLIISAVTTLAMALGENFVLWTLLRLISGVASGICFVQVSSLILDKLAQLQRLPLSGWLYSGVGWGILTSSALAVILAPVMTWQRAWWYLGIVTVLLLVAIWCLENSVMSKSTKATAAAPQPAAAAVANGTRLLKYLVIAYGLEGFGYIITATFIVLMAANAGFFSWDISYVWLFVGLGAIPACYYAAQLAKTYGSVQILIALLLIQAVSMLLPVIWPNNFAFILAAVLFGATFMGITAVAVGLGKIIAPRQSHRVVGILTAVYAFGQILGPVAAGYLLTGGNVYAAVLAAAAVIAAAVILLVGYIVAK